MLEKGKISIRQLTLLVMLITIGDSILVAPSITALGAKQDAWISSILGMALGLLTVYIFSKVGKLYPQLSLIQSIQKIMGKWIGTLVALLYLVFFLFNNVAYMREIGDFMTIEMMQETPIQAIQILFICIVIMAVRLGLEIMGRTAEIFAPWVIVLFLILIISVSPQIEFKNLQPTMENGIKPVLKGAIPFLSFPFTELVAFMMLLPNVNQQNKITRGLLQGTWFGGVILFLIVLVSILVLGADQATRSTYPSYTLAKRISVGGFFERVEAMIAILWMLTMFLKISLYLYVFILGLAQLLKLKEYQMLALPTAMILISLSATMPPSITYYQNLISIYWPYYDLTYGLLFPLLLLIVCFVQRKLKSKKV